MPWSGFSGTQRKLRIPPSLCSGKKKISGVSMRELPKNVSFAEPRTVPPSPGHITQLGTSEVPCEYMFPDIPIITKVNVRRDFIS
ncbi:MAG: hypothetical protein VYB73_03965 [Verrucomicrobiota bacterium]|nr:hypothetical protein [Verrucomicrobiota bacterium]